MHGGSKSENERLTDGGIDEAPPTHTSHTPGRGGPLRSPRSIQRLFWRRSAPQKKGEPERRRDLIGLEGGRATAVVAQNPGNDGRRRRGGGAGWGRGADLWPRDRHRPSRSLARRTRTDELPSLRTRRGIIVWSAVGAFPRAGRPASCVCARGADGPDGGSSWWRGAEQV